MLDLSSDFNAEEVVRNLCENKKVSLIGSASFPKGWTQIVESFIDAIQNFNVVIEHIESDYDQLDIIVDISCTTQAKKVYTNLVMSKIESRKTCAFCGKLKGHRDSKGMYCRDCINDVTVIKTTGTWLDNY